MDTIFLPIPRPSDEQRQRNRERRDSHIEECAVCARGLTEKAVENAWYVHLTIDAEMTPVDIELESDIDLGWHPVGSECAKLIPKSHRLKF